MNDGTVARDEPHGDGIAGLANVCDTKRPAPRHMFEDASGSITQNSVVGTRAERVPGGTRSGAEGTFDATIRRRRPSRSPQHDQSQKTGIVADGDVDVWITTTSSAPPPQANLAANSIQLGFGALGIVEHNIVDGNQWLGASDFAATAILLFAADAPVVRQNNIRGNSDVGIYVFADGATVDNNRVFDEGADGSHGDFGIFNDGDNLVTNNKVRGFDTPYEGVDGAEQDHPGPQRTTRRSRRRAFSARVRPESREPRSHDWPLRTRVQ
jgi:hypothetical protein